MRATWSFSVAVVMLAWPAMASGQEDKGPPPKEPPPEVIAAWKKAGAAYGGMKSQPLGVGLSFTNREQPKPGELPAFTFLRAPDKGFAALPAIDVPFGLVVN